MTPPVSEESLAELQASNRALWRCVHGLLLATVVLSGVLAIYFFRQSSMLRRELEQLAEFVSANQKSAGQGAVDSLRDTLAVFAKDNPDFRPIFLRYFPPPQSATGATAPSDTTIPPAPQP